MQGVAPRAGAAREDPRHPAVHRAEAQLAGRGPVRSGSTASRMAISLVADALGARRMPSAWRARQVTDRAQVLPPDARCQRLPRGPLPHDARRPLVGDAHGLDRPAVAQGGLGHVEDGLGHQRGVELHQARRRGVGQDRGVVHMVDRGIGSHDRGTHPRGADIDDEDAPSLPLMTRATARTGRAGRACPD